LLSVAFLEQRVDPVTPIPEPSIFAMLAAGMTVFIGVRGRAGGSSGPTSAA
jgi:hypothetical protein